MAEKRDNNSTFERMRKYIKEVETFTDELMESTSSENPSWNIETCCLQALSNVYITPREVIVTADLPNIEPETVKILTLNKNTIEITARLKNKVRFIDLGIFHRQGEFTSLRSQKRVDVEIDTENKKISLKHGILEVRFPRKHIFIIENKK